MIRISVIVPVYNGESTLRKCLQALLASDPAPHEIVVIDDRSTDRSAKIAADLGARVIPNTHRQGPAGARNEGAMHATGDVLLFIDADVVARPETVGRIAHEFEQRPDLTALFGSYDTEPGAANFLSQYKNLFHHFVHQNSAEVSNSFWAGCGAIRAEAFRKLKGFDEMAYPYASIEDIELGLRITQRGMRIRLVKDIQVCHLKKWTPVGLLKADVLRRAVPWTQLMARQGSIPNDLNLRTSQRVSAVFAGLLALSLPILLICLLTGRSPFVPVAMFLISALAVVLLNLPFYGFFLRLRGSLFTIGVFFWHVLYYLYSSATFAVCWLSARRTEG